MKERNGNLLDLLILLLIGFGILCGVGRFLETRAHSVGTEDVATVSLRILATEAHLPSCITEGEDVFLTSGERFGEIVAVRAAPARVETEADGDMLVGTWETGEFWDVDVLLRVGGSVGTNGFLRDGRYAILVGQRLSLYTERAYLYGTVKDIRISAS